MLSFHYLLNDLKFPMKNRMIFIFYSSHLSPLKITWNSPDKFFRFRIFLFDQMFIKFTINFYISVVNLFGRKFNRWKYTHDVSIKNSINYQFEATSFTLFTKGINCHRILHFTNFNLTCSNDKKLSSTDTRQWKFFCSTLNNERFSGACVNIEIPASWKSLFIIDHKKQEVLN